ncbi:MAG: hypothetical protein FWD03_05125 [Defluviitaleaceae bacterium]|nr:hypothetical protein [Defluviitaleaceae bacterium]
MFKRKPKTTFIESLRAYDEALANDNLGIFGDATLTNQRDTKVNIFMTILGIIVGAITGHGFFSIGDPETGSVVVGHDGVFFFATKKEAITGHYFIPFEDIRKVVLGRNIVLARQLTITEREGSYRIGIFLRDNKLVEILRGKLKSSGVSIRKGKGWIVWATFLGLVIYFIVFGLLVPRWLNTYRAVDYANLRHEINNPTSTTAARYQNRTTSFFARIETDVFSIDFEDGSSSRFVAATISGNDRFFLIDLGETSEVLEAGEIIEITAVGMGAIATRARPPQGAGDRFFEALGVAFGDPRITGVVADISNDGILRGTYYLHMRAVGFDRAEVIEAVEGDTYVSASGNFRITFLEAYLTTVGAGQRQTEVIMIFYDYEAFTGHRVNRPISNNFTIYQGDVALALWEGGLPAAIGRGLLSVQTLEDGEVFEAMRAVIPVDGTAPIRIVRRDAQFGIIFSHEMEIGEGE